MAEIFAAVASGAGLLSLAIQLLESSRKLKDFYNASKDAPQTVADLSFELETMSLSLRQLETHRRADILDDQLIGRCVITCTRMTVKVEAAVAKMDHLLKRFRGVGMVYTAFKEPEMRKLLEELEYAKSSMLFAYMSYCQSWNMREAASRAADVQLQNALLSSHQTHLQNLDNAVQTSHTAIISRIETSVVQSPITPLSNAVILSAASNKRSVPTKTKRQSSRTLRLAFPRWLTSFVWEFAMHECEGVWNMQLRPINIRRHGSFPFDIVRSGDVKAVMNLLATGELSVSDREVDRYGLANKSPLTIAAEAGHLELCDYLLQEFTVCRFDAHIHEALMGFLGEYWSIYLRSNRQLSFFDNYDNVIEAFYELFLVKYSFSADLNDRRMDSSHSAVAHGHGDQLEDVHRSILLTKHALRDVIASQPVPFDRWSLDERFEAAVHSHGWPAYCFVRLVNFDTTTHLAKYKDTQSRTALHWAAEQLGTWLSLLSLRVSGQKVPQRQDEFVHLSIELIMAGADVHALDAANRTPFACMILGHRWFSDSLARATRIWGELLQAAGTSLRGFLEHENDLLGRPDNVAKELFIYDLRGVWTHRLLIMNSTTLAMEVGASLVCPIWEFRPPPGTWSSNLGHVDRIIWPPNHESDGHDWYLWQASGDLVIGLAPKLLCEPQWVSSLAKSIALSWMELVTGVQDDQGFVAATVRRTSITSGKREHRRRAASLPPPITMYGNDGRLHVPVAESELWPAPSRWLTEPHKCPFHLTWKLFQPSGHYNMTDYRRCMQGRCGGDDDPDWSDTDHWEAQLLKDERNVDIARRFTDRFRPQWRDIVEAHHSRAQRRAQLDIAVARA